MLYKVIAYVKENQLIEKKDRIVVGVSGGADSVCLFSVLLELQREYELELFVVHIHHGIRGEEADRDEAFVRKLAEQKEVPYFPVWREVPALAGEWGMTEEEAGRRARYEAFSDVLERVGGNKIAVAHNRNDCAETVLFQLLRGSGLKGLCGIPPKREQIIRPLLCVEREEIEAYLKERGQKFCTDRTNLEFAYTRNKIRLSLLPAAEKEINQRAVEHIARTAELLREVEAYVRKNAQLFYDEIVIEKNGQYFMRIAKLEEQDIVIQRELIKLVLYKSAGGAKDIEAKHIESVRLLMKNQSGKRVNLPYRIVVWREYEFLVFAVRKDGQGKAMKKEGYCYELIPDRTYRIEEAGWEVCLELLEKSKKCGEIPQNTCVKWFDYDKIENGIRLRSRRNGDYLQINAGGGRKKLKDYFIDKKIPREERENIALLADGSHIVWILGDRISERYKLTEATQRILKVKITEVR